MIDLHMHTNYSDGSDNVIELLKKAEKQKLEIIAITDHNNCNVYNELKNINISEYYTGRIINGVELTTNYNGTDIELLGYGIDIDVINDNVGELYKDYNRAGIIQMQKLYDICLKLKLKFDKNIMDKFDVSEYIYPVTYLHKQITKHEENRKFIPDEESWNNDLVFYRKHMCDANSQFHVNISELLPSCTQVYELIKKVGGLVFIPHVFIYGKNADCILEGLLKNYNIDGIECFHSIFTNEQSEYLIKLCKENNLYISGGSDYHGAYKPDIQIGTGKENLKISKEVINAWVDKVIKA